MLKRVDVAVYEAIRDESQGQFSGGTKRFGLANQGVDYALDENNDKLLTPEMRAKLDRIKAEIIAGKIKVPDYYKMKK